jgi:CRP-like cAMP-binding protein
MHGLTTIAEDNAYRVKRLETGEKVALEDNAQVQYCLVRSGWVGLFSNRQDGSRQMLRLVLPGEAFWLRPNDPGKVVQTVEALTPANCCWLSRAEIDAIGQSDASYMAAYVCDLERELALIQDTMTNIGRRDATAQVAQFLVSLAMRATGKDILRKPEPCRIPLTQRMIGDALGLTQIHVNRTVRNLRLEGLLTYQSGIFIPLDPGRLSKLIDFTPQKRALWLASAQAS